MVGLMLLGGLIAGSGAGGRMPMPQQWRTSFRGATDGGAAPRPAPLAASLSKSLRLGGIFLLIGGAQAGTPLPPDAPDAAAVERHVVTHVEPHYRQLCAKMLRGEAMDKYFNDHLSDAQASFMTEVLKMKAVPGSLPASTDELTMPLENRKGVRSDRFSQRLSESHKLPRLLG